MLRSCPLKDLKGRTISGLTNSLRNLNPAGDANCNVRAAAVLVVVVVGGGC